MPRHISTNSTDIVGDGNSRPGSSSHWVTTVASTTSSTSTYTHHPPPANPDPTTHPYTPPAVSPQPFPPVLQTYWKERAKFIKHLEKKSDDFARESKEEYDRARWGKQPKKKTNTKGSLPPVKTKPARVTTVTPVQSTPTPAPQSPSTSCSDSPTSTGTSDDMIASTSSKGALRAATALNTAKPLAASFSTSARAQKSAASKRDPTAMDIQEATRVLRALEITKPGAAYSLNLQLKMGKHNKAPSIRGRVSLPHDPRRQTDIILVFAEANSVSARLAREAGVTYVGAAELFEPLLNGEINPTKVLCTPGMLSAVTGRLARFLGPKGLMPTARRGGVGEGEGLVERIQEARGAMDWKTNGWGVVRCAVGRVPFTTTAVEENVRTIIKSVRDGMSTTSNTSVDEHLISRRQIQAKQSAGITAASLESSNGPRIALRDF